MCYKLITYCHSIFTVEQYIKYAYSIVSEYLPIEVQKPLLIHLGLPEKVECIKRKADKISLNVNKKVKHDNVSHDEMPKVEKVNIILYIYDFIV